MTGSGVGLLSLSSGHLEASKDPVSAGAHILSYYLSNPLDVERAVKSTPEAFGDLQFDAIRSNAQQISLDLLLRRHGPPLATCAREFAYARMASRDQATLAAEYPVIYQDLLKKRASEFEWQAGLH